MQVNSRIAKVFKSLKTKKVLLFNTGSRDPNFLYVTGFTSGLFEEVFTLVERSHITVFSSRLEYNDAELQAKRNIKIVKVTDSKFLKEAIRKKVKGSVLGVNESFVPYNYFKLIKNKFRPKSIVDCSEAFAKARLTKDDEEVARIRKASHMTKTAMRRIIKFFKVGITEKELAAKFDFISAELGSEDPSFKTIVCFGKNSALPHHAPNDAKLKKGEIILIDAGAKYKNYCSDVTRTFIFNPDKKSALYKRQLEIYNTVKTAQTKAVQAIKPGVKASNIHKIAEDYINNAFGGRYKGLFIHSLGHSVGLEVHDGLGFSSGSKHKLEKGMVISAEPGIYILGFGGVRIEDDILITDKGYQVL